MIVFTKLDKLYFQEKRRLKKEGIKLKMSHKEAEEKAEREYQASADAKYRESCVQILQSVAVLRDGVEYCVVSNKRMKGCGLFVIYELTCVPVPDTVLSLIRLTKRMLGESEALSILWARAQMVSVQY